MFRGQTSTSDRIRDRLKKRSDLTLAPEMPYVVPRDYDAARTLRAEAEYTRRAGFGPSKPGHPLRVGAGVAYDAPTDYAAERASLRKKFARTRGDRLLPDHLRVRTDLPYHFPSDIGKAQRAERAAYTHEESLAGMGRISRGGFQRHPSEGLRLDYTDISSEEYMAERARLRKKFARTRGDRLLPDHLRVRTDLPYHFPSDIGKAQRAERAAYTHEESRAGVGRVGPRTSDDVFRAIEEHSG